MPHLLRKARYMLILLLIGIFGLLNVPLIGNPFIGSALAHDGDHITVQPGDTLSQIAQRYSTDTVTLRRLNNLSNDDYIEVGSSLRSLLVQAVLARQQPLRKLAIRPAGSIIKSSPAIVLQSLPLDTGPILRNWPKPMGYRSMKSYTLDKCCACQPTRQHLAGKGMAPALTL